jgi:hypothetical protein
MRPAFQQDRTWRLARQLVLSAIVCLGRRTITGLICTQGDQYRDWGRAYRLFEKGRFNIEMLFAPIRKAICLHMPSDLPIVAALDDTIVRKRGRKIAGTSWRRDPLGPNFCNNFIWAQRFVQLSLMAPVSGLMSGARAIPVDVIHAPTPRKPGKRATEDDWAAYRRAQAGMRASKIGAERIANLRTQLDSDAATKQRSLVVSVDGGYTNQTVFRDIPAATTIVGRIRKDACLFHIPPERTQRRGRNSYYGAPMPTPEALRQDQSIPWQTVSAHAAGKIWNFDVKVVAPVRWKGAGSRDLQVVVVRPIAYRLRRKGPMQYRQPAYLVCTDVNLPVQTLLQAYLWRWEIELNFHDEKSIMGMGQAQVRTQAAVKASVAFAAASHAVLNTAAVALGINQTGLPLPAWRKEAPDKRCTTNQLINRTRAELWGKAIGVNLDGFDNKIDIKRTVENSMTKIESAVLYAAG